MTQEDVPINTINGHNIKIIINLSYDANEFGHKKNLTQHESFL